MHTGDPVGVGRMIWPHGRWRVELRGEANHAGTTPLADRHDPMLDLAAFIAHVRRAAEDAGALATVGKLRVDPNGVNAIPSQVTAWLDVRAEDESAVRAVLAALERVRPDTRSRGPRSPCSTPTWRTSSPARSDDPPRLGTGAGHDAGILAAAGIPTAMLFVRNPSGISHAPAEDADEADCLAGIDALAAVLERLLT